MARGFHSRDRGFPLLATFLILLGVLFLLQNFGLLPEGVGGALLRLWPLILVILGLQMVLGRGRSPWIAIGVAVAIILLGVALALWAGGPLNTSAATKDFHVPIDGARSARVAMDFGAGQLALGSLLPGSPEALKGTVNDAQGGKGVTLSSLRSGDTVTIKVSPARSWFSFTGVTQQWDVFLSPDIPHDLAIKAGASSLDLDLREMRITTLDMAFGASSATIRTPRKGETRASIDAGAASIQITIPEGVAARIQVESGLTSVNVDTTRFPREGASYRSPDYATARDRIALFIKAGAAGVTVS